jgi:mono/diheme cytochrome c family protein
VRARGPLIALALLCAWGCSRSGAALPPAYRDLDVPEERLASAQARERGRALFAEHCALCHGERADGRGARREGLSTRPRDFTDPAWRRQTSPRAVFVAIREGVSGTPMPSWKSLDVDQTWDIVAFLLSIGNAASH